MTTPLRDIIQAFSPEDQAYIHQKAGQLADEMVRHADSLAEVRQALVRTQDEVAQVLKVKQNAVAQLERRSDLLLSTLRKYVEAMGGELAVAVRTGAGHVIMLDSLSSLSQRAAPRSAKPVPAARKAAAGRAARTSGKSKPTKAATA